MAILAAMGTETPGTTANISPFRWSCRVGYIESSDNQYQIRLNIYKENIVRRRQQKDQWCWIASAEMIGKYVNPSSSLTQGDVATTITGLGLLNEPNFSAWFPAARKAVELFGGDKITGAYIYGKAMEYPYTIENIEAQRPLLAYLSWDLLSGHDVVVSGYSVADQQIRIVDPWEDTPTAFVPYAQAITGYQFTTGYGKYANSIYIGR